MKKLLLTLTLMVVLSTTALASNSPVRIAVLDTGISASVIASDNLTEGDNYILPSNDTQDRIGHGTAVSAIIVGSEIANLSGLCPTAQLVPLVYYDKTGDITTYGDLNTLSQMICDAVDVYQCQIINISAGTGYDSPVLRDAIAYAEQQGALVVASVGNDGNSALYYPAVYDTVVAVGSADGYLTGRASFSNYYDGVDLLAQGIYIPTATLDGDLTLVSGTSFSTAIVTGIAAQLLTDYPDLTPYQLRTLLQSTATDLGTSGYDTATGYGLVNLAITASQVAAVADVSFTDVGEDDALAQAVAWAAANGITTGTTQTTFSPEGTCTRAQVVTFLWRAMGCPEPRLIANNFTDVGDDAYYATAVLWAVEFGVSNGITDTEFAPDRTCTQGEVITLLWRAMSCPMEGESDGDYYYSDALLWLQTDITPTALATRGDIVTYLYDWAS